MSFRLGAPLGLLGLALVACEDAPPPQPRASATPTATVDVAGYCSAACSRAARCGLEEAEKLVRATPAEQARLTSMRSQAESDERACRSDCEVDASADAPATREAERCLEQTSCETFRACLAREPSGAPASEARR